MNNIATGNQTFDALSPLIRSVSDLISETLLLVDNEGFIKSILARGNNAISDLCEIDRALDAILGCELEICLEAISQAMRRPNDVIKNRISFGKHAFSIRAQRHSTNANRVCVCLEMLDDSVSSHTQRHLNQIILNANDQGLAVLDGQFTIQSVNKAFCRMLGVTEDNAIGRPPFFLDSITDRLASERIWSALGSGLGWKGEYYIRNRNGEEIPLWLVVESVRDENGEFCEHLILFTDISKQQQDRQKRRYGAHHDALTGLPNREAFFEHFSKILRRPGANNKTHALLVIDIMHFQYVNDSIGYELANQVLIEITNRLQQQAGAKDYLARIGGDDFALIVNDIADRTTAAATAKKILRQFSNPLAVGKYMLEISINIGISLFPTIDCNSASQAYKNADTALYSAKKDGGNCFKIFSAAQAVARNEFFQLEMGLRQAKATDQLTLAFQPQFDISTHRIVGAEVFTRWNHPILGPISPSRFIPVAEKSGFIDHLGDWILDESLKQMGAWRREQLQPFTLAINLSRQQLIHPGICKRIRTLLEQYQLDPRTIEFEIAEPSIANINKMAVDNLRAIAGLGCQISLDDFGTDTTSIGNLKRFQFSRIKIDQTFISNVPSDRRDTAFVKAILVFARSLGMTVVAEGVETEDQARFLREHGCSQQQGYLYSQAINADEFKALLTQ